ncbi:MAG: TonB-dependent receptor [Gammaproteobacteria bacterium]|nr:TonB-dependent receptor [Gammaproteobacteria bacterium]MDH5303694.1 TonB-dependent receptor [Gammaproteobacteria bacterium]MDH5322931.1 TonB-dependent receptor [Gammaproteobacteria bacterium]
MQITSRLFLICLALVASPALFAQSGAADDFDQIIVTGARAPLATSHLGSAATVITRADIEQRQARYVADLLRAVPGFAISQTGVTGSQIQVRVRGAEANHVLVLIDGVRANDPATGDEFHWEYLTTSNVERIEVVRGPQSSLWGSDAIAAVVHVITRDGQGGASFNGYLEGGSFATSNLGVGGSMGGNRWSFSAAVERLETDGGNISRSGNEDDGSDITTASLAAQFRANDALTLDTQLRVTDAWSQFDSVDFFVTGLPTDGNVATAGNNLYASVGTQYGRADSRLRHKLSARFYASENRNYADDVEDSSSASERTTFAYQADIGLGANLLSLALERESTDFEQRGAVLFGDPNQDQQMDVSSFIAEYQGRSHAKLTWLISGRFDNNSDFEDAITGRFSLAYAISAATTLRSNIGTGHKNPTFTELFGYFPEQFVGNPDLQPERSTSYDIGIDYKILDGAVLLQASLFKQDLEDEINGFVFDPQTFFYTAENEATTSKRQGAEFAARWRLGDAFDLVASYTYTDSEQDGEDEIRRPKHAGSLTLDYRSLGERVSASLAADYSGTRTDSFFPPFPEPMQTVTLANYWLLDMTVQYQLTESATVYARGSNLLDEDYEQVYGYQTPDRAAYLGLRVRFGR